jgi:DNA-binding NarL/FixJ family response regulator
MIDVLLVDDHPVMRELLRHVLEVYPDLSIVAEAANGEDAIVQATRFQPSVAIVDVRMPTMNGIEATKKIRVQSPSTVVIGLTAGQPDHEDLEMISAGAAKVIDKADVVNSLYPAIINAVTCLKVATPGSNAL